MNKQTKKRRRRWLPIVLGVLAVVCAGGWFWLNSKIESELTRQLKDAGIDSPRIGSVKTGLNGITASDISFTSGGVSVALSSLEVHQPILDLIQNKGPNEQIRLRTATISINGDELEGGSGFELGDVDLDQIGAIAKRFDVEGVKLKYFDDGGAVDLEIKEGSLSVGDDALILKSRTSLLEGEVILSGSIDKSSGDVAIDFGSDKLHLVDQKWQNWPGIGPAIQKHLGADSVFSIDGSVTGRLSEGLSYRAEVCTTDSWLYVPKFDLRVTVRSADVLIEDGVVTYRDVYASMGERDVVHAHGTTTIGGLPCVSEFEGEFSDADVADLRKLVKEIPDQVVGTATGKVTGSVVVDDKLDTTLRLSASGDTKQASYGDINASKGFVDVQITPLVISPEGKTLDLQGAVVVKASTSQQNVDGVLSTFDLQSLDHQFEFDVFGDGDVDLKIPLDSAPDLRTWDLLVNSKSPTGSVSGVALKDLVVKAFLQQGKLVFDSASAQLAERPESEVSVKVTWPLPNRAVESIEKTGTVTVSGSSLPPKVALSFFDSQMRNAGIEYRAKPQIDSLIESELGGGLNFQSSIVLPTGKTPPVKTWIVDASLVDSSLFLAGESMNQISSSVSIRDGLLSVDSLKAKIGNGGNIDAAGELKLATGDLKGFRLQASRFPAAWLAKVVLDADETGRFADRTGMSADNVSEKLSGVFDAEIGIDPNNANNYLWRSNSEEIVVLGNAFRAIEASGHYDGKLDIEKIDTELPGGGVARLEGDWLAETDEGQFSLKWTNAAVVPLLKSQIQLPESFESKSEGELEITFANGQPQFTGEFDLIEPMLFGGTFADHRFKISTKGKQIFFADIPNKKVKTVALNGSFNMNRPFEFQVEGQSDAMPLSTGILDKLSGNATSNFQMSGQASPWKVKTRGTADLDNLKYDKAELSRIKSRWDFDSEKPAQQQLEIIGLGGKASFDSAQSGSDSLAFKLERIDLSELAAFRKLPVGLSGTVAGSVTVEHWNDPGKQRLKLSGTSDLVRVGNGRLTRVEGEASLSNGGRELSFGFESQFLDGKLSANGDTQIQSITDPFSNTFPLTIRLSNGRVSRLAETISSSPVELFRQLEGRVSTVMQWEVKPGEYPNGTGSVAFEDVKYRNRRVSRKIESGVSLANGIMQLKGIRAELQQGEISGKATIPLVGSASGTYALDVRNFSLARMLYVLVDDPIEADGVVNARISGRTGQSISGGGTLGISQAGLFGVSGETMKIPVRYRIDPSQRNVRIEMPNNRIKAFRGTIEGSAKIDFGTRTQIESKLEFSNIDSQRFVRTLTGYQKPGSGKLSGKLVVASRNYRSEKDLSGSFRGKLKQSDAFSLPVLDQIARFLGSASTLRNDQFESDSIELTMSKGVVNVRQFRLQNALASVIVSGQAWLNGKLDLEVAARIERLNQPTLIEQLAGSPIARIVGPEAAFFAQAAEFLSERIVFVDVTGNAKRPQLRLNPGKQLKEEAIRYFLRGSQILPNGNRQNN